MIRVWRTIHRTACADGPACLAARVLLLILGLAVLTLGVYSLPSIAVTAGEIAVGVVLSLPVAVAILYAAVFPGGMRRA